MERAGDNLHPHPAARGCVIEVDNECVRVGDVGQTNVVVDVGRRVAVVAVGVADIIVERVNPSGVILRSRITRHQCCMLT